MVVSEMVDSAVGGAGSENVTSYLSVIEYGVNASTTEVTGTLVPIEVKVAVASCNPIPYAVLAASKYVVSVTEAPSGSTFCVNELTIDNFCGVGPRLISVSVTQIEIVSPGVPRTEMVALVLP